MSNGILSEKCIHGFFRWEVALSTFTWNWNGIQTGLKLNLNWPFLWIIGFLGRSEKIGGLYLGGIKHSILPRFSLVFRPPPVWVCWEEFLIQDAKKMQLHRFHTKNWGGKKLKNNEANRCLPNRLADFVLSFTDLFRVLADRNRNGM